MPDVKTPPPLSPHDTLAWRLSEADLITGAIALSEMCERDMHPEHFVEAPITILKRIFSAVRPGDLTRLGGKVWADAERSWNTNGAISWRHLRARSSIETRQLLDFYEKHGMGVALQAPVAAQRLLAIRAALMDYRTATTDMVDALKAASESLRGVVGVV